MSTSMTVNGAGKGRLGGVTEELRFSHKETSGDIGTYTTPQEAERHQVQPQQGIQAESIMNTAMATITISFYVDITWILK